MKSLAGNCIKRCIQGLSMKNSYGGRLFHPSVVLEKRLLHCPSLRLLKENIQSEDNEELSFVSEIDDIINAPTRIGEIFQQLSNDSRNYLKKQMIPLETFFSKYPSKYVLFRDVKTQHVMASLVDNAPGYILDIKQARSLLTSGKSRTIPEDVLSVLRYIPNDWALYISLGIPKELQTRCMSTGGYRPKKFFEKYSKYFDVKEQAKNEFSFYVRRSQALQNYAEKNKK